MITLGRVTLSTNHLENHQAHFKLIIVRFFKINKEVIGIIKKIVVGVMLIVVVFALVGCAERDEFELCPELDLRIRQDFTAFTGSYSRIILNNGVVNGWQVVFMSGGFQMDISCFEVVAGVVFIYGACSPLLRNFLWKEGIFLTLSEAYNDGVVSVQDLEVIQVRHHRYLSEENEQEDIERALRRYKEGGICK